MDIIVSARHFDLTESLKQFTEDSVHGALDDLTLKISTVRVTLDIQKNVHSAVMVASIKGGDVTANSETIGDMKKSIAEAAEKLGTQARKSLEKKQDRRDRDTLNTIDAEKE